MALTSRSVWRTESAWSATRFAALSCCAPSSARSARACPISSFPSRTNAWTVFAKFSNLSKLMVAVRERPMACAASCCLGASSPLPSPLCSSAIPSQCRRRDAVPRKDLARQGDVCLRAFAFAIEVHGGSAEARRVGEAYVAWNHGFVHLLAEVLLQLGRHLLRERIARIVHGSKQPFDIELRIQVLADLLDGVDQIGEPLECVVFALHRDHHRIGCHQPVQSEYVQGRRTVEQDELVLPGDRLEGAFQAGLAVPKPKQVSLGAGTDPVGPN